jgi:hypothetical protein
MIVKIILRLMKLAVDTKIRITDIVKMLDAQDDRQLSKNI